MEIGIGLPNAVRGVDRRGIVEWARRAETAGFSSLGTIDRIVFPNYESLIALSAAAAVTERIRLLTDILIAPLRSNTALLAKQVATIDSLSEGRMVLGISVGGRPDDYQVSGVELTRRGRIFDQQLAEMAEIWSGERGVGPAPFQGPRPQLLIGGGTPKAFERTARYADGWTTGGGGPAAVAGGRSAVLEAWRAADRDGDPRIVALCYFALGDDATGQAGRTLGDYYGFAGPYTQRVIDSAATDQEAVRSLLAGYEEAGTDEVIFFPTSADPGQVDRLGEVVFG